MCSQLKIPEEQQIIKLCAFSFVDLLRALESPNVQSAEDTRGEADYLTFPIFFSRFAAGVGITKCAVSGRNRGEDRLLSFCPFLLALESLNVMQSAEDTEEQQTIKLFPFSFVDLLRALESPNVRSAEDTSEAADY
jgi:hypothetical protein